MFLQLLSLALLLLTTFPSTQSRKITIHNRCPFTTFVGIQGPGNPLGGGFKLEPEEAKDVIVDDDWTNGRIWTRTRCTTKMSCGTGDCGNKVQCNGESGRPPYTTAIFNLSDDEDVSDSYKVSLVDGYNVPIFIKAFGGVGEESCGQAGACKPESDVNRDCPQELSVVRGGVTVGCHSPCRNLLAEECVENPTAKMFKDSCKEASAHKYDDETRTCSSGAEYLVQLC